MAVSQATSLERFITLPTTLAVEVAIRKVVKEPTGTLRTLLACSTAARPSASGEASNAAWMPCFDSRLCMLFNRSLADCQPGRGLGCLVLDVFRRAVRARGLIAGVPDLIACSSTVWNSLFALVALTFVILKFLD